MAKKKQKLTLKQKMFCKEYIIDFNATQASIRAGYSVKTAQMIGSENLSKPMIQKRVAKLLKKRRKKYNLTAERVAEELGKLAFADSKDLYDENGRLLEPHELPDEVSATIASHKSSSYSVGGKDSDDVKTVDEYKRYSKEKALELLGRHFGMFSDKLVTDNTHKIEVTRKTLEGNDDAKD